MNNEVLQFFGLSKPFYQAAFMETELIKQQTQNIKSAISHGGIIVLTGMVGVGKTTLLWKIQQQLIDEKQIVVCRSLSTDKKKLNIITLYTALFFDLVKDKNFKREDEKHFRVIQSNYKNGVFYQENDVLKLEAIAASDLLEMASDLQENTNESPNEILFYDLDQFNFNSYEKSIFEQVIAVF